MISAIEALAVLEGGAALSMLQRLEETDESLKVRQAAIEARKAFFPEAEPWPREWEENAVWLPAAKEPGRGSAPDAAGSAAGGLDGEEAPACPIPAAARSGQQRPDSAEVGDLA